MAIAVRWRTRRLEHAVFIRNHSAACLLIQGSGKTRRAYSRMAKGLCRKFGSKGARLLRFSGGWRVSLDAGSTVSTDTLFADLRLDH